MSAGESSTAPSDPIHVLREFALIADGERGALIGPDGNIEWMCVPRWHNDAVFSRLIGGLGRYQLTPSGRFTWGGSYEEGTLIWHSRWIVGDAIIESDEALALPTDHHRAVLLRRIHAVRGNVTMVARLDVRAGFGHQKMTKVRKSKEHGWTARSGDLHVRWSGADQAEIGDGKELEATFNLVPGDHHDLVLEISDGPLAAPEDPARLWTSTREQWRGRVPRLDGSAAPRDSRMSSAVLHGLTSSTGGMVAAATMSLPERADRNRSYDYRYAWVRDQCYAGIAAAAAGLDDLLDTAVGFVTERLLADGPRLAPAYRVDGGRVPDEHVLDLPGYPGGTDVAGNWVNGQFQLDAFGETLRLLADAARRDRLEADGWRAMQVAVRAIGDRWDEADAGIWELDDDWWTQSRLACVAGLRQAAAVSPGTQDLGTMLSLAEDILAKTTHRCLHPDGYWQRSPTKRGVDTSLVWPAVCGALAADDPRTIETLAVVTRDLTRDHYAYRYQPDGLPLGEAEGAFLLCGFMLSLAHLQQGSRVEAVRWFERNRAACGSPGLFTEEYDITQRQLRGNLPQAFVHAALLQSAAVLGAEH